MQPWIWLLPSSERTSANGSKRARGGEEVVIADSGIPVARLLGLTSAATLEHLTAEGMISHPPGRFTAAVERHAGRLARRYALRGQTPFISPVHWPLVTLTSSSPSGTGASTLGYEPPAFA
jgi:antitoxin (DNA-binding transcriptional repressor) of toxin-antitoxin stability system